MALTVSGPVARRWLQIMAERLAHLARLWFDDLLAFVPAAWCERWGRAMGLRSPFVVAIDAVGGWREVGGSEHSLRPETIRDRTRARLLALRIDDAPILRRRLGLPSAAVARLDAALDLNLSTWTPFAALEVYAAVHPLEQARLRASSTAVELRCVPRHLVDERITALHALGLDPDAIELGDARFTLPRPTRKRRGIRRHRWLLSSLALLLLGQSIGVYALVASRQYGEIETLETTRAAMVMALRRQADAEKVTLVRREGSLKLAARMDEELSVSRALGRLAMALPGKAVIREFVLDRDRAEGHVAILGAAGLDIVAILSKTGYYRVRDLNVLSASEVERKVFTARFVVIPWIQTDGRAAR